jgi:hypothetical protein
MSQIDFVAYFPEIVWFVYCSFFFYVIMVLIVIPKGYLILRIRHLYINEIFDAVFNQIRSLYLFKKFIIGKLYIYKSNDYINYFKKLI